MVEDQAEELPGRQKVEDRDQGEANEATVGENLRKVV